MAEKWNLNWLASNLSLEERQKLLKRLDAHSKLSNEPLYFDDDKSGSAVNIDVEYSVLSWYSRLWFRFQSLFMHKTPKKIFWDHEVSILGKKIEKKFPGLYDYRTEMLLPVFYQQAMKLKDAAQFFYSALDSSVNRDKEAFFSFVGSLEMPNVHRRLVTELAPAYIAEKHSDVPETEWRQLALKSMEGNLNMITKEQRTAMYSNARSLFLLKELSSFSHERLVKSFSSLQAARGFTCSAGEVKDLLITLNNILVSLKAVPQISLLESLFVFILQRKAGIPGFNIDKEIDLLLSKAEKALTVIREFNRLVPLTWILRCSSRELALSPKELSGGEEWFVAYRDYWKKQIETLLAEFLKDRRQMNLLSSFDVFLKGNELKTIENIRSNSDIDGIPVRGAFAISFLYTFCSTMLVPDINRILYLIFIGAEFKKEEDRVEFSEAYSTITVLEEEIRKFEHKVSPSGEYGRPYIQARSDISDPSVKRRRMQTVTDKAQDDAGKILEQARGAVQGIVNILNAILGKSSSGKNDILYNSAKLAGKDKNFIQDLGEVNKQLQNVLLFLAEMDTMESGR